MKLTLGLGCDRGTPAATITQVIAEALSQAGVLRPVLQLGLPDVFIEHGDPAKLLALQGLDAAGIERAVRQRFLTPVQG